MTEPFEDPTKFGHFHLLTDDALRDARRRARESLGEGNLAAQASARLTMQLLDEVAFARYLVRRLYHHIADAAAGRDELQALLERYAGHLGVVKPGAPDVH